MFCLPIVLAIILQAVSGTQVQSTDSQFDIKLSKTNKTLVYEVKYSPKDRTPYWLGIALNPDTTTMRLTDHALLSFTPADDSWSVDVSDRYSERGGLPLLDTALGGRHDFFNTTFNISSAGTIITRFERLLDTGDKFDFAVRDQFIRLSIAHGFIIDGEYQKHKGTVQGWTVNVFADERAEKPPSKYQVDTVFYHGLIMVISWWAILVPSSFMARYAKLVVPSWFFYHRAVNIVASVAMVASFVLIIVFRGGFTFAYNDTVEQLHGYGGILLVLLILPCQLTLGYLSNKWWKPGQRPMWWDKLHWAVGYVALIGGVGIQTLSGIKWYGGYLADFGVKTTAEVGYWIGLGVVVVSIISFERLYGQAHEHVEYHSILTEENAANNAQDAPQVQQHRPKYMIIVSTIWALVVMTLIVLLTPLIQ